MSTSKPFAADEESVLMAFSMEPNHGRETLERYIREYPQHATALIDCSIDLLYEAPEGDVPATEVPDSAIDKAWQRFERAVQQPDAELRIRSPSSIRAASSRSHAAWTSVTSSSCGCAIGPFVLPPFLPDSSRSLRQNWVSPFNLNAYLQGPPGMVSGHAFGQM